MNILVIDHKPIEREHVIASVEAAGHRGVSAGTAEAAWCRLEEEPFDVVLLDLDLPQQASFEILPRIQQRWPKLPIIVSTAHATIPSVVQTMRRGAVDYLEKPFSAEQLRARLALVSATPSTPLAPTPEPLPSASDPPLESQDEVMKRVSGVVFRAAATAASILILGESGTGKSMLARAVHERSFCQDQPFVTVNCPSLSRELLESDLFGHVKGAFTGAFKDTWGKVQAAEGGTLFLDEIGELPLEIQPKLLRLLQEREYERVGESKTRTATVRVITASNKNLKQLVAQGLFREDLYYRLNVIAVELPPLRQRPDDLIRFAQNYLEFFSAQFRCQPKHYSEEALERIRVYGWPGNLRELRNAIERAVILSSEQEITPADLPLAVADDHSSARRLRVGGTVSLKELEIEHIRRVLSYSRSLNQAAKILGIDKTTLYRKRKRLQRGSGDDSSQHSNMSSPP